ncbi:hypothetical protein E8E13_003625 [Curvularia kusanoi]|uniref:Uncharacterized protein n=1 Tax=Curvularia kusanoi TaxID=90978 RepID=A0A9P4T782_CURKU|nr:hypothetical protein E8E13_003625 [Curvularia kusanoi]
MGNLCGKQSKDAFDGPGRTLGSAPAPATKASVPTGAASASTPKQNRFPAVNRPVGDPDAKGNAKPPGTAAADAAEARANKAKTGGALQNKLDKDKSQTTKAALDAYAKQTLEERNLDQNFQARQHN